MASLFTLANFYSSPEVSGSLIEDADGNLFGTTLNGGPDRFNYGTVFEIVDTAGVYASTPTTLVTFDDTNGADPEGSVIADANGNLFGTNFFGGAGGAGTVFEIVNTAGVYASTPTTLVTFNGPNGGYPHGSLTADESGSLFGTTSDGGSAGDGTVFEIVDTAGVYASAATTLVTFAGNNGSAPVGTVIADVNGNLFGTTSSGGAEGDGTVFEIANTTGVYASTATTLVTFDGTSGSAPSGSLIADANGDLFGTTSSGGAEGDGTVFEIVKIAGVYASAPITLVTFNGSNGSDPKGSLIADANGDLFGTTHGGGAGALGTVFEIAKTAGLYASAPTTLVTFNGGNGSDPEGSLIADGNGNLFGTTAVATVFELTDAGFATCFCPETCILTSSGEIAVRDLREGDTVLTVDGVAEQVRWIGRRDYDGRFIAGNHLMLPVTIQSGALSDGVPHTDLQVSPGHGIVLDGYLVPAWRLINGVTITQAAAVDEVHYFHVELHRHAVLLANGAPAESFIDDAGCRGQFANASDFHIRFPDAPRFEPVQGRLEDGFALRHIQTRLATRAGIVPSIGPAGVLRGFVDQATPKRVCGWAQDVDNPEEPVEIEVRAGSRRVLQALANAYRADLRKAGIGSGCHAFDLALPNGLDGAVTVRRVGDGAMLRMTEDAKTMLRAA